MGLSLHIRAYRVHCVIANNSLLTSSLLNCNIYMYIVTSICITKGATTPESVTNAQPTFLHNIENIPNMLNYMSLLRDVTVRCGA